MPKELSASGKIVLDYLQKFPNTPNHTLAKTIYDKIENKLHFTSAEAIRNLIRYYRGAHGNKLRKDLRNKSNVKPLNFGNNYGLMEGLDEGVTPFKIPLKYNRQLVISDVHVPFHNLPAVKAAIRKGEEKEINCLILDGDILDFYMISRFEKNPLSRGLKGELEDARVLLRNLRRIFPDAYIVYKEGNHEERWEAYLKTHAPMLLDIEEFKIEKVLRLADEGIIYVKDKRIMQCGKVTFVHGHELPHGISAPVNPARGLFLRCKENAIAGHNHRTSEHTERTLGGKQIKTWSIGCLCNLNPKYMPINAWNHGFGYNEVESNGDFRFTNYTIINGVIY